MGLQTGNVHTNPGKASPPSITLAEFHERFTEQHRSALGDAETALWCATYMQVLAESGDAVQAVRSASARTAYAREALQLLGEIHPPKFGW